ncbi:hypothetical protein [Cupriavidus pinatubonensis]
MAGKNVTLRAALNMTNRQYWGLQYENYLQPGDPRSISVTARMTF